jgi:hypothetical protein
VAEAVGALAVDVEIMMRVLDGRDRPAAPRELGHELFGQRGLARILPAGNAEHAQGHGLRLR